MPGSTAPDWSEFEWTIAKAAAVLHGVTPLIASLRQWHAPAHWQQFAQDQYRHTAARQRRTAALLVAIDQRARDAGIACVALKGAALHALGFYAAGQRPMADIDLLVREHDATGMTTLLQTLGFGQTSVTWKHRILMPLADRGASSGARMGRYGEDEDTPLKIELHTRVAERLPVTEVDITALIFPHTAIPGINPYPSSFALLLHLLLHAAGNILGRNLRLIQLHDIALLAAQMTDAQWQQLTSMRVSNRRAWWAVPPLQLVQRYFEDCVPPQVLSQLRPSCPRVLNWIVRHQLLADVSYARLRGEAVPGLAWGGSLTETLRCIWARLMPSAELRAVFEVTRTEAWAASTNWSRMTRGRRALHFLIRQPPRLPAMYIVRAALAASNRDEERRLTDF
jgi:Uncharacterised nucleotidyltransferase